MVHAGRPAENLTDRAGAEVFLDIESIPLGMSFPEWIDREIASCDAVLVVIGDDWLALSYEGDPPRIESASDWVRVEIEAALERGVLTIPVLVEGAAMPRPDQLPDSIRGLAHRNAAELRDSSWRADFERIAAAIERSRRQPEPQIESDLRWPGRFSDSWFATNVPRMDAEQLEALRGELHRRNWTDAELAERVLVHTTATLGAVGVSGGPPVAAAEVDEWPDEFTDSWFRTSAPSMSVERVTRLLAELRRRQWTEAEIESWVLSLGGAGPAAGERPDPEPEIDASDPLGRATLAARNDLEALDRTGHQVRERHLAEALAAHLDHATVERRLEVPGWNPKPGNVDLFTTDWWGRPKLVV